MKLKKVFKTKFLQKFYFPICVFNIISGIITIPGQRAEGLILLICGIVPIYKGWIK